MGSDTIRDTWDGKHGKPMKRISELFRRKGSRGTNNHHAYASVYVILRNRRFTLSILPLRQGASLVKIVLSLLRDAEYCGINTKRLFLDKEFCTAFRMCALNDLRCSSEVVNILKSTWITGMIFFNKSSSTLIPVEACFG